MKIKYILVFLSRQLEHMNPRLWLSNSVLTKIFLFSSLPGLGFLFLSFSIFYVICTNFGSMRMRLPFLEIKSKVERQNVHLIQVPRRLKCSVISFCFFSNINFWLMKLWVELELHFFFSFCRNWCFLWLWLLRTLKDCDAGMSHIWPSLFLHSHI